MKVVKVFILVVVLGIGSQIQAQDAGLMNQIKEMAQENDPEKSLGMMKDIIKKNDLREKKDAEVLDMMKGNLAMDYLEAGNYAAFDRTIASIRNKFNQTSYMNMAATNLVNEKKDLKKAEALAKKTLDLFLSFRDDPKAKPADFEEADWKRFMDFAYYPYCDTYAMALHANGKYKEALAYQEKAFQDSPENGMLSSVERYADLLARNDREEEAYALLLNMAEAGKSTEGMNALLKDLYIKRNPDASGFDEFFAGLQKNVVAHLKTQFQKNMQDTIAPSFTLKDTDGNTVSLSDFRGKIVVIDFWATWCAPCKASFPAMSQLMKRHPEVKFLYIATQEKQEGAVDRVKEYITQNNYPFHVLMDEPEAGNDQKFQVLSAYKVKGIPTKIVVDARGKQRFFSVGYTSDTELINEMEAMIQIAQEL